MGNSTAVQSDCVACHPHQSHCIASHLYPLCLLCCFFVFLCFFCFFYTSMHTDNNFRASYNQSAFYITPKAGVMIIHVIVVVIIMLFVPNSPLIN